MTWELLVTMVSVCCAILAATLNLRNSGRSARQQERTDTATLTEMQVDIRYIKQRVDGLDALRDRLSKAQGTADAANSRLDRHLKYDHGHDIERRYDSDEK